MTDTKNKFFSVKASVEKYKDAEFFALHTYTFLIGMYTCMLILFLAAILIFIGIVEGTGSFSSKGIALGVVGFIFAITSNTKPSQFLLKAVTKLLFGSRIAANISKTKKEAKEELYNLKDTILEMEKSSYEWKEIAVKACNILRQENIFLVRP